MPSFAPATLCLVDTPKSRFVLEHQAYSFCLILDCQKPYGIANFLRLQSPRRLWQADQAYLHIVVSHEDIHDAEALLQRAALLCGIGNDELRPALAELRAAMSMVAETQQISAKNIL